MCRWSFSGPVAIFSYCGQRQGKARVMELAAEILPSVFQLMTLKRESLVIDGDRAATLNRMLGQRCSDGRVVSYRFAHFLRFEDDKVIEAVSLIDTFNATEQMLGHALPVHDEGAAPADDLVIV